MEGRSLWIMKNFLLRFKCIMMILVTHLPFLIRCISKGVCISEEIKIDRRKIGMLGDKVRIKNKLLGN